MSLTLANRRFQPRLLPTILALLLVPALMSLGFWQLRRAEAKRVMIEQFQTGTTTTQDLSSSNVDSLPLLQTVVAHGHYDSEHQVLLDNMPSERNNTGRSAPGFHALTPLIMENGDILLVDRGWLPLRASRSQLPDINVTEQIRSVRGRLADFPQAGVQLGKQPTTLQWPKVFNFPRYEELRAIFGDKLLGKTILLDPAEPDGMQREWTSRYSFGEFGPERHIAYAVQWFGLSFTLAVLYLITQFRKPVDNLQ